MLRGASNLCNPDELIRLLNIQNIFPPLKTDPQELLQPPRITKDGKVEPRRPLNAFFICRQNVLAEAKRQGVLNMRLINKATGILWSNASISDRCIYEKIAAQIRKVHREKFPSFRYAPQRPDICFRRCILSNTDNGRGSSSSPNDKTTTNNVSDCRTRGNELENLNHYGALNVCSAAPTLAVAPFDMMNNNISSTPDNQTELLPMYPGVYPQFLTYTPSPPLLSTILDPTLRNNQTDLLEESGSFQPQTPQLTSCSNGLLPLGMFFEIF